MIGIVFQNALLIAMLILFGSGGHLCLKKGATTLNLSGFRFGFSGIASMFLQVVRNGWLMAGVILMGLGFVFYVIALSRLRLNLVYPIFVTGGITLVTLGSFFILKEPLHLAQVLGMILIVWGIFLLFAFSRA
ncbi:MAG: SMR family transporter [Patescibacteria group bacterium]